MLRTTLALGLVAASLATASAQANHRPPLAVPGRMEVPAAVHRGILARPLDPGGVLHLSISLAPTDPEAMEAFVRGVSDPASPDYRHFLTPAQVGARFGVSDARIQAVTAYLKSQGMKVTLVAPNRLAVLADATVAQAERAFDTTLAVFHQVAQRPTDRADFFAYTEAPKLPSSFASSVVDIGGLENATRPVPRSITAAQTRGIYGDADLYNNGSGYTGAGRTLAISNFDGYRLSNVSPYYTTNGLPAPSGGVGANIQVVVCGTASGTGTPQGEGDLDIQMVLGMAPLCAFKIYDGSDLVTVLTREANDNVADIISESYGWNLSASQATSAHNLHLSMSAQGITYLAATGDSGTTLEPYSYPDYEPEVLQVGGTIATASGNARGSEVGWSGSGGGWSTNAAGFNVLPSWQKGTGVPTGVNHRLVPDVALNAAGNGSGAYPFYLNGSQTTGYNGTSFASPVLAGLLGIAEQRLVALNYFGSGVKRLGRLQDLIYRQNGRSDVWYDVTSGSNGKLPDGTTSSAHAGWDTVTGWGAINIDGFVAALAGSGGTTPPPTTYYATSVGVNGSTGTVVSGNAASLNADDANYYTVSSILSSGYEYASTQAGFALPAGTTSATVSLQANGPSGTTEYLYAYNYATGAYDAIQNSTLTGADKSFTATLSSSYFSSSGAVTLVEWTYRSGSTKYTLKTDVLTIAK